MADKTVTVINRGLRSWTLRPLREPDGKDKNGDPKFKETPRVVEAGKSIECLDDAEAKHLLGHFRDFANADDVVPTNAKKISEMQAEITRLTAENLRLAGKEEKADGKPTKGK